jgi:hypothetical protein
VVSTKSQVEDPLVKTFAGRLQSLAQKALEIGGKDMSSGYETADLAFLFQVLPRVPVMLVFWDAEPEDGFDAQARLLFDETITQHLDIESIMFLSERIKELLCS